MKIITINREYGAGGHSIGTVVAKELGVELYDRAIIRETAKQTNLEYDQIEGSEEEITRGEAFMRYITPISYEHKDYFFDIQKQVILDIAKKGPCVIIGRCADAILQDAGFEPLRVFLYADTAHRAAWVSRHIGSDNEAEVLKFMHKQDRSRKAYYEVYTDRHFGDKHNYDLLLDSGRLGYETCEKLIIALAKAK